MYCCFINRFASSGVRLRQLHLQQCTLVRAWSPQSQPRQMPTQVPVQMHMCCQVHMSCQALTANPRPMRPHGYDRGRLVHCLICHPGTQAARADSMIVAVCFMRIPGMWVCRACTSTLCPLRLSPSRPYIMSAGLGSRKQGALHLYQLHATMRGLQHGNDGCIVYLYRLQTSERYGTLNPVLHSIQNTPVLGNVHRMHAHIRLAGAGYTLKETALRSTLAAAASRARVAPLCVAAPQTAQRHEVRVSPEL
jgi:hypothetical protein